MNSRFHKRIDDANLAMQEKGVWKTLQYIETPMDALAKLEDAGEVVILSSNNYLGLANHPKVIEAAMSGIRNFGAGTASVRFICGTFIFHRQLEEALAVLNRTEAALSYVSCWNANTGVIPVITGEGDCILSDELNHASIIDGIRMSKAIRKVYKHSDMESLKQQLEATRMEIGSDGTILIITDGVFSMEGDLAQLPEILALAENYGAVLMVDDSHGTGVIGLNGRGIAEYYNLEGSIDVITGTLGKALGGAAGGYVASSKNVIDALNQHSRPQLFSNALPASVAMGSLEAIKLLQSDPELLRRLRENTRHLRIGLKQLGFKPLDNDSAIIPIIVGKTAFAIEMSNMLLDEGVFVTGFGYPVVPEGSARIRVQASAVLSSADIERALCAFKKVGQQFGVI